MAANNSSRKARSRWSACKKMSATERRRNVAPAWSRSRSPAVRNTITSRAIRILARQRRSSKPICDRIPTPTPSSQQGRRRRPGLPPAGRPWTSLCKRQGSTSARRSWRSSKPATWTSRSTSRVGRRGYISVPRNGALHPLRPHSIKLLPHRPANCRQIQRRRRCGPSHGRSALIGRRLELRGFRPRSPEFTAQTAPTPGIGGVGRPARRLHRILQPAPRPSFSHMTTA